MSADPRIAMQADLPVLDPLARARLRGERTEALEARQEEARRAAKRDEIEAQLAHQAQLERLQILERGYTDSELAHWQAGQDAARREQIEALEAELTKLDPQRGAVKRAETVRAAQAAEDDRLLEEARRGPGPFMADQVRRFRQRQGRVVTRSRRPFDVLTRTEQCLWCIEQDVSDEESYLLHSDPEWDLPVTPPGQRQAEADQLRYEGTGRPAEISR